MRARSELVYWTRGMDNASRVGADQQQQQQQQRTPLVLIHGVAGLVLYLPLLLVMYFTCPDTPLLVLDMRHVGLRLW